MTIGSQNTRNTRRLALTFTTTVLTVAIANCAFATAVTYQFASQMDGFWDFNSSGSELVSKSPGNVTLVNGGGVTFAAPIASANGWTNNELGGGQAAVFTSAGDNFLAVPNGTYLGGDFTFVVASLRPASAGGFNTILGSNRFRHQTQGDPSPNLATDLTVGGNSGSTSAPEDNWNFSVLTYNSTTNALSEYLVTNSLIFPASPSASGIAGGSITDMMSLRIGGDGVSGIGSFDGWEGQLDFAAFDNSILSNEQMQSLFNDFLNGGQTPEPTTGLMVIVGICGLAMRRRKRALARVAAMLLVGFFFAQASPAGAGVVSYWTFDGQNANDGNGVNNGVEVGGPAYSSDVAAQTGGGYSLSVDGTNRVTVAHSPSLLINDTITIIYRVKADSAVQPSGFTRPISRGGASPAWEFQRDGAGTGLSPRIDTSAITNQTGPSIPSVFDNSWHQVVFRIDTGTRTTFKDGVLSATSGYSHGTGFGTINTLGIGATGGGGSPMNGLIDDVQIWDEALSNGKVIALYDPILGYTPSQMETLFNVFDTQISQGVGAASWSYTSGLSLGLGQSAIINDGRTFVLQLDALGNGVVAAIPEPSTALLLGLGLVALVARRRRGTLVAKTIACSKLAASATLALLLGGIFATSSNATLVAYYDFDSSNATDGSGNGNNGAVGTSVGFSTNTPFGSGLAASFNAGGGTGQISIASSTSLETMDDTFSVSFWIKEDGSANPAWHRVIRKGTEGNPSNTWGITRYNADNDLAIRYDTNFPSGGAHNQNRHNGVGTGLLDDAWHMVTYVADNGTTREFVDGVQTQSTTYTHGNGLSNTEPLVFNNAGSMIALIDDVGFYDSALTNGMVSTLFSQPFGLSQGNLGAIFEAYDNPGTVVGVGAIPWRYVTGLSLGEGNSQVVNGTSFFIQLDAAGNGVVGFIPEPSTALMLTFGLIGLVSRRRRKS